MAWAMILTMLPIVGLFGWAIRCCCQSACGCVPGTDGTQFLLTVNASFGDGRGCVGCECLDGNLSVESGLVQSYAPGAAWDLSVDEHRALFCGEVEDYNPENPSACTLGAVWCSDSICSDATCEWDCADLEAAWLCGGYWWVDRAGNTDNNTPLIPCLPGHDCGWPCSDDCYVPSDTFYGDTGLDCLFYGSSPVSCEEWDEALGQWIVHCSTGIAGTGCNPYAHSDETWTCDCEPYIDEFSQAWCACYEPGFPCNYDLASLHSCDPGYCTDPTYPGHGTYTEEINVGKCVCSESGLHVSHECQWPVTSYCGDPEQLYLGSATAILYQSSGGSMKLAVAFTDINGQLFTGKTDLGDGPLDCSAISATGISLSFRRSCWCWSPDYVPASWPDLDECPWGDQHNQFCATGAVTVDIEAI